MSGELTLLVIRLAFLAVMWIFVFSIVYALRSDLFGSRSKDYQKAMEQSRAQTFGAAQPGTAPAPQPAAAPRPAPQPAGAPAHPAPGARPRPPARAAHRRPPARP